MAALPGCSWLDSGIARHCNCRPPIQHTYHFDYVCGNVLITVDYSCKFRAPLIVKVVRYSGGYDGNEAHGVVQDVSGARDSGPGHDEVLDGEGGVRSVVTGNKTDNETVRGASPIFDESSLAFHGYTPHES